VIGRRFPPPRSVEDIGACFVVKDHGGQKLAYVYFVFSTSTTDGKRLRAKLHTYGPLGGYAG
jgi:hypothetical protein